MNSLSWLGCEKLFDWKVCFNAILCLLVDKIYTSRGKYFAWCIYLKLIFENVVFLPENPWFNLGDNK